MVFRLRLLFDPSRPALGISAACGGSQIPGWRRIVSRRFDRSDLVDRNGVKGSALVSIFQRSYDSGRTWHLIVRDLPSAATSYDTGNYRRHPGLLMCGCESLPGTGVSRTVLPPAAPSLLPLPGQLQRRRLHQRQQLHLGTVIFGDAYSYSDTNRNCAALVLRPEALPYQDPGRRHILAATPRLPSDGASD